VVEIKRKERKGIRLELLGIIRTLKAYKKLVYVHGLGGQMFKIHHCLAITAGHMFPNTLSLLV
jgi:hypothetical protein